MGHRYARLTLVVATMFFAIMATPMLMMSAAALYFGVMMAQPAPAQTMPAAPEAAPVADAMPAAAPAPRGGVRLANLAEEDRERLKLEMLDSLQTQLLYLALAAGVILVLLAVAAAVLIGKYRRAAQLALDLPPPARAS